jgi:hypothetical protein
MKYITNIEVNFGGYLYIMYYVVQFLMNARLIENCSFILIPSAVA